MPVRHVLAAGMWCSGVGLRPVGYLYRWTSASAAAIPCGLSSQEVLLQWLYAKLWLLAWKNKLRVRDAR